MTIDVATAEELDLIISDAKRQVAVRAVDGSNIDLELRLPRHQKVIVEAIFHSTEHAQR